MPGKISTNFRFDPKVKDALKKLANKNNMTMTAYITMIVRSQTDV